jgi:hypothetical protein
VSWRWKSVERVYTKSLLFRFISPLAVQTLGYRNEHVYLFGSVLFTLKVGVFIPPLSFLVHNTAILDQ